MKISTDWTLVLQEEISAQEVLINDLNLSLTAPMSPTTTRGTQSLEEKESHLAKSQLGFINLFAEPLWAVGATAFFPGMQHGLTQIRENKQVWMTKVRPPLTNVLVEPSSSSTAVSMEANPTSPQSPVTKGDEGKMGVRTVVSSSDLNGEGVKMGRDMRRERSFSSLMFWRKKGRHQKQQSD